MPFNVLLLPLLGGYLLLTHWNRTRFATKRYSGERLIFHSAIAGVALLCLSFLIVQALIGLRPGWYASWREVVPFAYTGTSLGAFVLGATTWWPLNRFLFPMESERRRVIREWGDHLEELLEEAIQSRRGISISTPRTSTSCCQWRRLIPRTYLIPALSRSSMPRKSRLQQAKIRRSWKSRRPGDPPPAARRRGSGPSPDPACVPLARRHEYQAFTWERSALVARSCYQRAT
jgi:hypothetical protein